MISEYTLRVLRHIASLDPGDLTAVGPVVLGTENCRTILAALQDAETLAAVRGLLSSANVSPKTLRALLSAAPTETFDFAPRRSQRSDSAAAAEPEKEQHHGHEA